jgi:hypothetical protein
MGSHDQTTYEVLLVFDFSSVWLWLGIISIIDICASPTEPRPERLVIQDLVCSNMDGFARTRIVRGEYPCYRHFKS